jgi:curved DNA-binding protein CbpA
MLASCFRDTPLDTPIEELGEHFATLGCTPDMTAEEVRRHYRSLAKQFHPDLSQVRGDGADQSEEFRRIQEAYQAIRSVFS